MRLISFVLFTVIFLFTGCTAIQLMSDRWHELPDAKKIEICQKVFKAVQPKCQKLEDRGQEYVNLCSSVVEDAVAACEAVISKDGSVMCARIEAKTEQCQFISDNSENQDLNIQACENVIHGTALVCQMVARPKEEKVE